MFRGLVGSLESTNRLLFLEGNVFFLPKMGGSLDFGFWVGFLVLDYVGLCWILLSSVGLGRFLFGFWLCLGLVFSWMLFLLFGYWLANGLDFGVHIWGVHVLFGFKIWRVG